MYLLGVFILLLPFKILCFNINTNHFLVYVDPQKVGNVSSNYFGYTVVMYPGNKKELNKWVKIGAPKGNDPKIRQFHNTGVVYDCPFGGQCKPLNIKQGHLHEDEFLTGACIGGSMDINYKFNKLAICGFRTMYEREIMKEGKKDTERDIIGSCYLSYFNTSIVEEVIPLEDTSQRLGKIYGKQYFKYAKGEAGFSVHIPENENDAVLGAPGVFNWAGTLIDIVDVNAEDPIASRLRMKRSLSSRNTHVADPSTQIISKSFQLFGYSVTSGYFFGRKLYYAASAPKFDDGKGKVVIVQFHENNPLIEKTSVVGNQIGEYFGAATTAGDLNHDGFDDLMVGAPYHAKNMYNEGAVYIFLGGNEGRLKKDHTLYGQKANGQFGSSIMFLGDINNDGFGDLAVGAPYEEEFSGVLYIYRGNKEGINLHPCQRIIGKDILPEIRGFGISISRPADMDGNGYNDILVGAYLSGHAVLLRTSPIVVVHYEMNSIPKELKQYSQNFSINICYWTTHFQEPITDLRLNRTIVVDELLRRAVLQTPADVVKIIPLIKNKKTCENVTVILRNTTHNATSITAFLSYKLVKQQKKKEIMYISEKDLNGTDTFCIRCPVLDETRSSQPSFIEVPFDLGCGSDKFCQSELTIDAEFLELSQKNRFVVGSTNYLKLQTTTKNTGENAYSTHLEITLPDIITLSQMPSECYEQNATVIVCNVDNPLQQGKEKKQILNLDMKKINKNNRINEISIAIRVLTRSNNSNPNQKVLTLTLKREADITISGKSEQQSVPFGNVSHGMPNFMQKYQVEKIGASPLEKVLVNITIPHAIRTSSGEVGFVKLFPPRGTFAGQPVTCTSTVPEKLQSDAMLLRRKRQVDVFKKIEKDEKKNIMIEGKEYDLVPNRTYFLNCSMDNIVCSSVLCMLGPFEKYQTPAVILIEMIFDPSGISHLLGEKDLIFYTTQGTTTIQVPDQFIQHGTRPDFAEVSTLLIDETKKKKVALWIIILAVIAGILLLILIIYGLTKVGFFKRTKKEELKNLKAATQQMIEAESHPQTTDPDVNCSEELADDDPFVNSSAEGLTHDHKMNASTEGLVDDQKEDNVFK